MADPQFAADTLTGDWTYRSFLNDPTPTGGDPELLRRLLFAEARFGFAVEGDSLTGVLDWGSGGLDLTGTVDCTGARVAVRIEGHGRPGTGSDGWQYDYEGRLTERWPNGIDQVPVLTGSVIRVKPHNGAAAGLVASFYAVKRP